MWPEFERTRRVSIIDSVAAIAAFSFLQLTCWFLWGRPGPSPLVEEPPRIERQEGVPREPVKPTPAQPRPARSGRSYVA